MESMSGTTIKYDYSVLLGKIKELYGTQEKFAEQLGIGRVSLSQRLNSKLEFSTEEMSKSVQLLEMDYLDIPQLFFKEVQVQQDCQTNAFNERRIRKNGKKKSKIRLQQTVEKN